MIFNAFFVHFVISVFNKLNFSLATLIVMYVAMVQLLNECDMESVFLVELAYIATSY